MSLLPATLPARHRDRLARQLADHDLTLGPLKPGTRLTHTVEHDGATWEITYLGPLGGDAMWRLTGPGYEHGVAADTGNVAPAIGNPAHIDAELIGRNA